ncbi:hypothetical protein GCM10010339_57520 [Streptomyces alanosinicus]|uniref:Uncharacterized protein n=1 Tax=Streptomyces alanosinicus TaxID=68171 RepID=A0A918YLQ3_9ACTN|nr:hypothetical protein GCM10010339_57520 [Streptomyces alanosinicus]
METIGPAATMVIAAAGGDHRGEVADAAADVGGRELVPDDAEGQREEGIADALDDPSDDEVADPAEDRGEDRGGQRIGRHHPGRGRPGGVQGVLDGRQGRRDQRLEHGEHAGTGREDREGEAGGLAGHEEASPKARERCTGKVEVPLAIALDGVRTGR